MIYAIVACIWATIGWLTFEWVRRREQRERRPTRNHPYGRKETQLWFFTTCIVIGAIGPLLLIMLALMDRRHSPKKVA